MFGKPDHISMLFGVDVFCEVMRHGWWRGTQGSPMAFETTFGWILAGSHVPQIVHSHRAISLHTSTISGDDLLRKFWEIEERVNSSTFMSAEASYVITCTLLMGICCLQDNQAPSLSLFYLLFDRHDQSLYFQLSSSL